MSFVFCHLLSCLFIITFFETPLSLQEIPHNAEILRFSYLTQNRQHIEGHVYLVSNFLRAKKGALLRLPLIALLIVVV